MDKLEMVEGTEVVESYMMYRINKSKGTLFKYQDVTTRHYRYDNVGVIYSQ